MLQLKNIRVRSFSLDHLDVYWEPVPGEDPLDYNFIVLRSQAQNGPYVELTEAFKDQYHLRDSTARQLHANRKWFYRIRVTRISDNKIRDYPEVGGIALEAAPDLEALEMARMEQLRLEEYKGRFVLLFPKRTFGQRCLDCWDNISQMSTKSNCLTCFGTSFVGGFLTPVQVRMEIIDPIDVKQDSDMGSFTTTNATGRLANFPEVKPGDVIVEAENKRWIVASPIRRYEKLRAIVRQEFSLHEIAKSDVVYRLPINLDQATLQASPIRQFTNPSSDDDYEFYLDDLGAGSTQGVQGPNAATETSVARFSTGDGRNIVGSTVTLDDLGNMDMNGGKITNLSAPTVSADAATKAYVDGKAAGQNSVTIINDDPGTVDLGMLVTGSGSGGIEPITANLMTGKVFFGIAGASIGPSATGLVYLDGVATTKIDSGDSPSVGDRVYATNAAGVGSITPPSDFIVEIGFITSIAGFSVGTPFVEVYLNPQPLIELN